LEAWREKIRGKRVAFLRMLEIETLEERSWAAVEEVKAQGENFRESNMVFLEEKKNEWIFFFY